MISRFKHFIIIFLSFLLISCGALQIPENPTEGLLGETVFELSDDKMAGRETGTTGEKMAADYIAKKMREIGVEPYGMMKNGKQSYFQTFTAHESANPHGGDMPSDGITVNGRNVVGFIDNNADHTVVLGAHYDHLGMGGFGSLYEGPAEIHNGADDNASGVAVMLYIAQLMKEKNVKHSNFLLIAFSGEEKGLWGSNYYVKNPTLPIEEMNYMINFDMVGRLENNVLAINGTGTSPSWVLLDKVNKGFDLVKSESGIGPSDHTSFYLQDVPSIHFFTGQHEDYHKPSDDADKLNYAGCYSIAHYVYRLINKIGDDKIAFTKTKDEQAETRSFKVTLGVIPDYLFQDVGMRIDGVRSGKTADVAGILKGDIVIKMGDLEIEDMMSYMKALGVFEPGQTVDVVVLREGKEFTHSVTFQ